LEARGRNETHEGNKKPFSHGDKERGSSRAMAKIMLLLKKREKNSHANIVQKMAMMKTIVGNFILKEDPKSLATKGSQRLLQPYNMI
jgi:hypothetical protein